MVRLWCEFGQITCILLLPTILVAFAKAAEHAERGTESYIHSRPKLAKLAQNDFNFAQRLKHLTENSENEQPGRVLKISNMYLEDFANSTTAETRSNATAHAEECVKNPLSRFKLLRRVASLFRILRKKESSGAKDVENLVKMHFQGIRRAVISGLGHAMDAILQIHFDYNLNVTQLAAGKLGGVPTTTKLLAFHCLQLGDWARRQGKYACAVEWLKEAVRLGKIDGTVDIPTEMAESLNAIGEHNWRWENGGLYDQNLFTRPLKSSFIGDNEELSNNVKAREALEAKYAGKERNCSYWPINTWRLCSGKNLADPWLFCWREFKAHKVLTVGPLKIEFLSRNPDIVQIYDAFSTGKASANIANGHECMASLEAVVSGAFSNSACALTKGGAQFQTTEFLAGAPSEVQVDALAQDRFTGRRDATLTLNLNNVDVGGYTVFPGAMTTSIPTQGSTIFWFNTLSDGSADFSTAHAHCPVILGQKLVAHRWLSFSNRKCLSQPKERFQILVNGKVFPAPPTSQHGLISEEEYYDPWPFMTLEGITEKEYYNRTLRKYAYGSMPSITRAIRLDWDIYTKLRQMAAEQHDALDQIYPQIQAYLQDFNESAYNSILVVTNETERNELLAKLAWNPLATYRTLWRLENYVKKWAQMDEKIRVPLNNSSLDYVKLAYNTSDGPTHKDLGYAMAGILVMQQVYDFKPQDISHGIVDGVDMGIQLSAQQCLEFGREAVLQTFYTSGVEWMETAVSKAASEGRPAAALRAVQMELEMAKKAHDMKWRQTAGKDFSTYTQPVSGVNDTIHSLRTYKEVQYSKYKMNAHPDHVMVNYGGVCQGKPHQTLQEQSQLFCWLETEVDPYWKIGPLKAEILSMRPKSEVVQFHDILNKQRIQYLQNDANKPSDFLMSFTTEEANPTKRLGAILWLPTYSSPESLKIMKIVEKATGLVATERDSVTALQLASYPPGSHYGAHADSVSFGKVNRVARIATFMFYLNDVERGGATSFAQAGVRVTPEAGSAIFWYNMFSNGERDDSTHHGACPVIFGEKHVATQWLHYRDQAHLQCNVVRRRRIEILVNGKSKYAAV